MIKILVVGDPGVGKSTLINQISENISASPLSEEKSLRFFHFKQLIFFQTSFGFVEHSTPESAYLKSQHLKDTLRMFWFNRRTLMAFSLFMIMLAVLPIFQNGYKHLKISCL